MSRVDKSTGRGVVRTDALMWRAHSPRGVYLLEFAGDDDRFAAREAGTAASAVCPLGVGLATARGVDGVERLAFTRSVADLVGTAAADVDAARALLSAASLDRAGSVAVRARDVRGSTGVDTQRAERVLGRVLVDRGFAVDLDAPDHVLRAAFAARDGARGSPDRDGNGGGGVCALGWVVAEPPREFAPAPTDRPFFQPGSMDPALARALANLAGARPGRRTLDPMCGTGGILVEAGLVGATVLGVDAQAKMVRGARENLRAYLDGGDTLRGDATRLPLADDAVDGVVFDAPYGRQSAIQGRDLASVVRGALAEAHRVAPRAVAVGDRDWRALAGEVGWTVESAFRRRVHRSLVRHVLVLDRT
jgi:tRNA (guanine10-N2)-dimethyltransferase